jgi:hypothetical protein
MSLMADRASRTVHLVGRPPGDADQAKWIRMFY